MAGILYFAYGSNLNRERMRQRIGRIPDSQRAVLRGFRLAFDKRGSGSSVFANIVPDPNGVVWGAAYYCSPSELRTLDGFEGVSSGNYRRETVVVSLEEGRNAEAAVYVAGDRFVVPEGCPDADYLRLILDGARAHRLPDDYVASVERLGKQGR